MDDLGLQPAYFVQSFRQVLESPNNVKIDATSQTSTVQVKFHYSGQVPRVGRYETVPS